MSNSNNQGALLVLIWLITIGVSVGSGIVAWNWIEPHSFLGAIGFLIIWGILSKIGYFIAMMLVALFDE